MAEAAVLASGGAVAAWLLLMNRYKKRKYAFVVFPNGAYVAFKDRVVIGRYTVLTAGYQEAAKYVSRLHFEIFRKGRVYYIRDLGSKNFTYLDGRRLRCFKPYPLHDGAQITVGNVLTLTFTVG